MSLLHIVREPIPRSELARVAHEQFGDMVKAVVDVTRGVMAIGGELHSGSDWIEYDSLINLRPSQGNRSRDVEDPHTRESIRRVVDALIAG